MRWILFSLLAVLAGLWTPAANAEVKPHPLFSDNMVLQRGKPIPVWGTASPNETVKISLESVSGKQSALATADSNGLWNATINPLQAGTGYTLTISGTGNPIVLKNVAVGEVWLCSGQSNMEWKLNQLPKDEQGKKVAAAATNPNIRLFTVPNRPFPEPQTTLAVTANEGKWLECKPDTAINFSAVGYFFGRDLQKALGVPIGLIASDWGGTPAQAWTSEPALASVPALKYYLDSADPAKIEAKYKADFERWSTAAEKAKADGKPAPKAPAKPSPTGVTQNTPGALYNGMIAPLWQYPIAGAIWYQGESNAGKAAEYYTLYPTMIKDWRKQWGYDFPFLAAQLAPFKGINGPAGSDYAEVRDALYQPSRTMPKVGVAVITDAGDENDIHPQKKEPVGTRLALAARAIGYGERIEFSGPVYKSLTVSNGKAVVAFDHLGGGLVCKGDTLAGFTACAADGTFHSAKAEIQGDTVVVTCEKVPNPVAVRFGWVNFAKPELNLFNKAGLPAVPFRTDNFPLTSTAKK